MNKKHTLFNLNRMKKNQLKSQFASGGISPSNRSKWQQSRNGKTELLLIEQIVKDIENGYEIDSKTLIKLQQLEHAKFIENIVFLRNNLHNYKEFTLYQIKDTVLTKLKDKYSRHKDPDQFVLEKKEEVVKTIALLDQTVQLLNEGRVNGNRKTGLSRNSQRTLRTKNNSIRSKRT